MRYLFTYDTVHGRLQGTATAVHDEQCAIDDACPDVLLVNNKRVSVFNKKAPGEIRASPRR
jgi:hypothetical protein